MRYKEYNVNNVLEKSIRLFWKNGFNGCSINSVVETTGVNRFSLYKEFGNKEGILYQSMHLYRERYSDDKFLILQRDGKLEEVLKDFYLSFLKEAETVKGCYILHIGTELADTDSRVKSFMEIYLEDIENRFVNLLEKHKYTREDASFRARHLVGLFCTTMSFCLIQTPEEREAYTLIGIKLILQ